MKVMLEPSPRRIGAPRFAVVTVAAWAMLVATGYALAHLVGSDLSPCMFKNATGIPCAACGGTRATASLAQADMLSALSLNPLVVVALVLAGVWAVVRIGFGRRITWTPSGHERTALWTFVGAVFLANWVYVISIGN